MGWALEQPPDCGSWRCWLCRSNVQSRQFPYTICQVRGRYRGRSQILSPLDTLGGTMALPRANAKSWSQFMVLPWSLAWHIPLRFLFSHSKGDMLLMGGGGEGRSRRRDLPAKPLTLFWRPRNSLLPSVIYLQYSIFFNLKLNYTHQVICIDTCIVSFCKNMGGGEVQEKKM